VRIIVQDGALKSLYGMRVGVAAIAPWLTATPTVSLGSPLRRSNDDNPVPTVGGCDDTNAQPAPQEPARLPA
jgi:hypothetical protein